MKQIKSRYSKLLWILLTVYTISYFTYIYFGFLPGDPTATAQSSIVPTTSHFDFIVGCCNVKYACSCLSIDLFIISALCRRRNSFSCFSMKSNPQFMRCQQSFQKKKESLVGVSRHHGARFTQSLLQYEHPCLLLRIGSHVFFHLCVFYFLCEEKIISAKIAIRNFMLCRPLS